MNMSLPVSNIADSPKKGSQTLSLKDVPLLLSNPYLPMETGVALCPDGMTHVAVSTVMKNCTGDMIDWWFRWFETNDQYKLWHPYDHVYSEWRGQKNEECVPKDLNTTYIGGHHYIKEYLGGGKEHNSELYGLRVSFKSPANYFGDNWEAEFSRAGIAIAVCARVYMWDDTKGYDAVTAIGHLVHLFHQEWYGLRLRSRFWLGDIEGVTDPEERRAAVTGTMATSLMHHAIEEMAILASVLPDVYGKETGRSVEKLA